MPAGQMRAGREREIQKVKERKKMWTDKLKEAIKERERKEM